MKMSFPRSVFRVLAVQTSAARRCATAPIDFATSRWRFFSSWAALAVEWVMARSFSRSFSSRDALRAMNLNSGIRGTGSQ